ncbi:MAG: hypothetical protein WCB68_03555 [Pyrinomonadaceae bacterium]
MTDVWEGSSMKGEGKILNAICLLIGLAFIGLIVWNFISAGTFIAIDSLFFTAVFLTLALLFFSVPVLTLYAEGRLPLPSFLKSDEAAAGESPSRARAASGQIVRNSDPTADAVLAGPSSAPVDARGRVIPPDVRRMLDVMSRSGQKTS